MCLVRGVERGCGTFWVKGVASERTAGLRRRSEASGKLQGDRRKIVECCTQQTQNILEQAGLRETKLVLAHQKDTLFA